MIDRREFLKRGGAVGAGLSLAAGGWLASANYVGYLVGALMALVARGSPQAMIRLGLLLVAGTTAAMAVTDSLTAWMILRFAAGVASAWVLVYVSALGVARPEVVFTGVGVGIAVAGLVCLALVGMQMASDVAWISLGVLALAATVSISAPSPRASARSPSRRPPAAATSPEPAG